jgi:hypothetical protein
MRNQNNVRYWQYNEARTPSRLKAVSTAEWPGCDYSECPRNGEDRKLR